MDKASLGPGPWQDEPDREEWRDPATGLPCLAARARSGAWCGYVAVPPGHPLHGKGIFSTCDLEVHGGITYTDKCRGHICHVPSPGEPDDVWWLGFDCCHMDDLVPGHVNFLGTDGTYRDLAYVKAEITALAAQLG